MKSQIICNLGSEVGIRCLRELRESFAAFAVKSFSGCEGKNLTARDAKEIREGREDRL
jgi:hypothetical protein